MAFTGRLGTDDSQLGNIELGFVASGGSGSFTANAVLFKAVSGSFTADAVISAVFSTVTGSFTADSILLKTFSSSFTANAIKRATASGSKTADAVLRRSSGTRSLSADAYITTTRMRHNRWTEHTGLDKDADHILSQAFGVYLNGENLEAVLTDLDLRITAREGGYRYTMHRITADAVKKSTIAGSLIANAAIVIRTLGSFTANAIKAGAIRANAWIIDPAIYIENDVTIAPTWAISATPKAAVISTASLTHDAVNDPPWFDVDYLSGWAKFTLTATHTVRLDTIGTQGDSVLELWTGSPGSWPSDPIAYSDDDVSDPTNPYGSSELIEQSLAAGTYYALVHPFQEPPSPNFNILLRIQITA